MGSDWKGRVAGWLIMAAGILKLIFPDKGEAIDTVLEGSQGVLTNIAIILVGFGMWAIRQAMGPSRKNEKA